MRVFVHFACSTYFIGFVAILDIRADENFSKRYQDYQQTVSSGGIRLKKKGKGYEETLFRINRLVSYAAMTKERISGSNPSDLKEKVPISSCREKRCGRRNK
jgi:hypothetical protein